MPAYDSLALLTATFLSDRPLPTVIVEAGRPRNDKETKMRTEAVGRALETTNMVLGVCLACGAFAFAGIPAAAWNAGIVGLLITCCAVAALYRYATWAEWSNMTLGYWTVASPFLLGFGSSAGAMWTHVLIGICVAAIATMQLMAKRDARTFEQ